MALVETSPLGHPLQRTPQGPAIDRCWNMIVGRSNATPSEDDDEDDDDGDDDDDNDGDDDDDDDGGADSDDVRNGCVSVIPPFPRKEPVPRATPSDPGDLLGGRTKAPPLALDLRRDGEDDKMATTKWL